MDQCPGLIGGVNDASTSCNIASAVNEQIDGVLDALPGNNPVTGWGTNGAAPAPPVSSSSAAGAGPASSGSASSVGAGGYGGAPSSAAAASPPSSAAPVHAQGTSTSTAAGAGYTAPGSGSGPGPASSSSSAAALVASVSSAPGSGSGPGYGSSSGSDSGSACSVVTVTTTMTAYYTATGAAWAGPSPPSAPGSSPSATPTTPTIHSFAYTGCHSDSISARVLTGITLANLGPHNVTSTACAAYCDVRGYSIAGTEWGGQCFCGDALGSGSAKIDETSCAMPCEGDASEICGGGLALSVFTKEAGASANASASASASGWKRDGASGHGNVHFGRLGGMRRHKGRRAV